MGTNYHTEYSNTAPKTAFTKAAMGAPLSELDRAITYQKGVFVGCDGAISWNGSVLTWTGTIHIYFTSAAGKAVHNSIAAGNLSVTDAYYAYVTLSETDDAVLTMAQAAISAGSTSTMFTYNRLLLGFRNAADDEFYPLALKSAMTVNNPMVYKGALNCSANPNYPAANAGWVYIVSHAGKVGGASGTDVEVGDMLLCNTDNTASGDEATVGAYWDVIQGNFDLSNYFAKAGEGEIAALTEKTTPVNADVVMIDDSASEPVNKKKRLSWENIKATLKTYFDGLYAALAGATFTGDCNFVGVRSLFKVTNHTQSEDVTEASMYGDTHTVADEYTLNLPTAVVGYSAVFTATTAKPFTLDLKTGTDLFILSGVALAAGNKITSDGTINAEVYVECRVAGKYVAHVIQGTFADGGA